MYAFSLMSNWRGTMRAVTLGVLAAALAALVAPSSSIAQVADYPNKPIRFIVSFPAGTATDQAGRLVAQQITKATGQPVVVDNRGGASGFIACEAVAKAPADGYTVLITTGTTHAANPALFRKLPYDPVKDFVPITSIENNVFVLVVAQSFAAKSVTELAKLAKANPGRYSFASANAPSRIGGEMFKMMSGTDLLHVPYKGAPQALTDVLGGQVSMMWTDLRTGIPQVQSGKLKALAVTGKSRLSIVPNVPTMMEQGFPEYYLANWIGAYLPANASRDIAAKLHSLIHAAVKADLAGHSSVGSEVLLLSQSEFAKLQASDTAMWARIVKAAGIEPE